MEGNSSIDEIHNKRTAPMEWTSVHDTLLCREVIQLEPYRFTKGSIERGKIWTGIADNLNSVQEIKFRVKQRSVRERYDLLYSRFRKKSIQEEKASGISPPEPTEVEVLLEEITERETLASSEADQRLQNNKAKAENERKAAEEIRKRAMETMSSGKKQSSADVQEKRVRRNGSDAIEFLKQKYETESRLREQELQLNKQQKEHEAQTNAQVIQQQQQMFVAMMQQSQSMQQALLKQQEQQNIALMAVLGKLAPK